MEIAVKPGQWGWTFEELRASWKAAEGCGFDRLSCFDHVSADGGQRAWDAPTLLAVMAAETDHIPLAVHVLNAALRNPFLLAGQLAVAQAASGGRLEVGLGTGSGWARNDHQVADIPFPTLSERVGRLEALCRVLPALWRGEEVTEEALGLRAASLGPLEIEVPPRGWAERGGPGSGCTPRRGLKRLRARSGGVRRGGSAPARESDGPGRSSGRVRSSPTASPRGMVFRGSESISAGWRKRGQSGRWWSSTRCGVPMRSGGSQRRCWTSAAQGRLEAGEVTWSADHLISQRNAR